MEFDDSKPKTFGGDREDRVDIISCIFAAKEKGVLVALLEPLDRPEVILTKRRAGDVK